MEFREINKFLVYVVGWVQSLHVPLVHMHHASILRIKEENKKTRSLKKCTLLFYQILHVMCSKLTWTFTPQNKREENVQRRWEGCDDSVLEEALANQLASEVMKQRRSSRPSSTSQKVHGKGSLLSCTRRQQLRHAWSHIDAGKLHTLRSASRRNVSTKEHPLLKQH